MPKASPSMLSMRRQVGPSLEITTTTKKILGDNTLINRGGHSRVPHLLLEEAPREKRSPQLIINGGGHLKEIASINAPLTEAGARFRND